MRIQSLLLLGALLAVGSQLPAVFGRKKGEKSGGCPPDDGPCLLSVPDQCVEDSQCPLTRKCCYRACFRHEAGQLPRGPTALPQPHEPPLSQGLRLLGQKAMLPQRLRPGLPRSCQRLVLF
ncbi:WAP four-disulfide core domain protein 5 isoform X2 [Pongo pygmaeus]|uniref:WAP four-disulfide core domain protein 5 isoform X2 n=1 Tax=Pongo pygmaeus TaxID=9600 RepID=UPI0023E2918F|nr:WAP four-disulfide core domain protein 5 isoform X2 [Pongo pygmaeus]